MSATNNTTARWYPTNISDSATHEAFRQAFDRLYATQDTVAKMQQVAAKGAPSAASPAPSSPPAAASLSVGAMVEAPKSSSSPGVLNQLYADGSYLYVYTTAGWRRVALSSF